MNNLLKSSILIVTQEELKCLREQNEITDEKKISDDIIVIRDWMKKEDHLMEAAEYLTDHNIERMYFNAKGSIEGTKCRIDKYCTSRGLTPELCLNRNIDEFDVIRTKVQYIVGSKLNPKDNTRIQILRFTSSDLDDVAPITLYRYIFMIIDYGLNVDYNFGTRSIVDYKNFPLSFFLKLNPMLLKKVEYVATKAYGFKVKGIHMMNVPTFFDKILTIVKQGLSEKLAGRIFIHSTLEDLHEHISNEILPKEYGGDEPSCSDIDEQWKQTLQSEDAQRIISNTEKVISDETRRSSCKFNKEYLGMPGTFRTLNVD